MKLPNPCPTHTPLEGGYFKYEDKIESGAKQRQCPHCLRWYFHGEFGKGWAKGLKYPGMSNVIKI